MIRRNVCSLVPLLVIAVAPSLFADEANVDVRILSQLDHVRANEPFWVAVELTMHEGWHTYFINPGDAGYATSVEWELPEGWNAESLNWPVPRMFGEPPEVTYGYDGTVLFPVRITPSSTMIDDSVVLHAKVAWLACKGMCIPGDAEASCVVRVGGASIAQGDVSRYAAEIRRAVDALPGKVPDGATVSVTRSSGTNRLRIVVNALDRSVWRGAIDFFAMEEGVVDLSSPPSFQQTDGGLVAELMLTEEASAGLTRLKGMLVFTSDGSQRAFIVDEKIE